MFIQSLVNNVSRCRDALVKAVEGPQARRRIQSETSIGALESRKVPAAVFAGNLQIVGSNRVDRVLVDDMNINGQPVVRVIHNGFTQFFNDASISGEIQFWGYGGNDVFDYNGFIDCFADGGTGNDYLAGGEGWDLLKGNDGFDTLEGWGGNDDLYGGYGNDLLDGGFGHDVLYGQWGNDLLGGGAGDDLLNGGFGYDVAFGGSGYDDFEEVGNDFGSRLYWPVQTRFGVQFRSAGVQDFNGFYDVIYS